jgi:hypothetical protein
MGTEGMLDDDCSKVVVAVGTETSRAFPLNFIEREALLALTELEMQSTRFFFS